MSLILFYVPAIFLFCFCSCFHSFQCLPVQVEVRFSGLSCRGLTFRVYSDAPLIYISYHFFLNYSHFPSKSIKKFLFKKETECFWTYMLET